MPEDSKLYHPENDSTYSKPYVDIEEWRDEPIKHLYVHGGFEDTNTRFSLYFPPKENYRKRFFHLVTPVQGNEDSSQKIERDEDNIGFAVSNGAYFVESNMGGDNPDPTTLYRSSAAVAEYSRTVASRLFGDHRPFGYIYGGSGGAFKTISCVESTQGIWDGSVPFVIGSPMSIPNMFTVRVHAMRLLRDKFPEIIDAIEPGGSKNMYEVLNQEQADALKEVTRFGFPPKAWFAYDEIGAGALPVLAYAIDQMDPNYYTDFWTKPGYLGADVNGSAARDRLQFKTSVVSVKIPPKAEHTNGLGVDEAWQTLAYKYESSPEIVLSCAPVNAQYLDGTKIIFASGAIQGYNLPLESLDGNTVKVGSAFGMGDIVEELKKVKEGDEVVLDNSDYIALQTYHRHQVPSEDYPAWDQYRDENGEPIYPQRPMLVGPMVAYTGGGSVQSGKIHGKMIAFGTLMDESALPWQQDWYRRKVTEELGGKTDESFRLYYVDHAMHGGEYDPNRSLHMVSYRGVLNQALLDVSDWVENGKVPPDYTNYKIVDAQVELPETADERKGIQPIVTLKANGSEKAIVKVGETVSFEGDIEVPPNTGKVTIAEFDFEGSAEYANNADIEMLDAEERFAKVRMEYAFKKSGTYFPVLRISSNRIGDKEAKYTQIKNIARVRVVVK